MLSFTYVVALLLLVWPSPTASDLVYNPSEWPPIIEPVATGSGAPVCLANPAFSSEVAFTASANLPPIRLPSANPAVGGVCPPGGNDGANGTCWWTCGFGPDGYPCSGPNDKRICKPGKWGLSYDDGPTPTTAKLLDSLKANNLKATFCLIGSNVVRFPEIAKRIVTEGHDVCIHTWSHPALTTLTNDQIIAELKWTEKAIQAATGVKPVYFRPPFGDIDNRVRAIVDKMGYKVLLWMFDNNDFAAFPPNPTITVATVQENMKKGVANTKNFPNGLIALSHPEKGGDVGLKLAEEFFGLAKTAGISLVRVSECLGDIPSVVANGSKASAAGTVNRTAGYVWAMLFITIFAFCMRTTWSVLKVGKHD